MPQCAQRGGAPVMRRSPAISTAVVYAIRPYQETTGRRQVSLSTLDYFTIIVNVAFVLVTLPNGLETITK